MPPPEGTLVEPGTDRITIAGKTIGVSAARHWLAFNKPAGVITTARDPEKRTTVVELLPPEYQGIRLFPVGRLDWDTTGLLLLTDDGDLANRLAHPGHKVPKEYLAVVRGVPGERDLRKLREGVELEDGTTRPAAVELLATRAGRTRVRIVITEGRNRQVRRMFEAIGHPVAGLSRVAFGPIRLGRLRVGGWRRLRPVELDALRGAAGIGD